MSFFTTKMIKLTCVCLRTKAVEVSKTLLELGVIDFKNIEYSNDDFVLEDSNSSSELDKYRNLRQRLEQLYNSANLVFPEIKNTDLPDNINKFYESVNNDINKIYDSVTEARNIQKSNSYKASMENELLEYLNSKNQFVDLFVGNVNYKDIKDLENEIHMFSHKMIEIDNSYAILTLKRDRKDIEVALNHYRWKEKSDSELNKEAIKIIKDKLEKSIDEKISESNKLSYKLQQDIAKNKEQMDIWWQNLKVIELTSKMQSYFKYTDHTSIFTGWLPEKDKDRVVSILDSVCKDEYIIKFNNASDFDPSVVPVTVKTNKFNKTFKRLVDNYSIPEYGTVNPLPFTMVFYLIMFAIMFADLGQGFVLLLIGILGKLYYKKNPLVKDKLISRYLCDLLLYLGPFAMIGGLLFGSFFGYEIIPPLWFNYHKVTLGIAEDSSPIKNVFSILGITFKFGLVVIFTGLVINWINLIKKKEFAKLILDKNGLVGASIFIVGLFIGYDFVGSNYTKFSINNLEKTVLIVSLVLLFFKESIYSFIDRKNKPIKINKLIGKTIMEFFMDTLEIFIGYMSNSLSFMRVAGLGIAHVYLMYAFEEMAQGINSKIIGLILILIGNIIVIGLEGLSAGVQALRLNYYEFFTKYFTGKGIAYNPISLSKEEI